MNYKDLGKRIKTDHPEYADYDDEALGRAYAKKFLSDSLPELEEPPTFFKQHKLEKAVENTAWSVAKAKIPGEAMMNLTLHVDQLTHQQEHLDRAHELERLQHDSLVAGAETLTNRTRQDHEHYTQVLLPEAAARKVDVPTYMQIRLEEAKAQTEIDKQTLLKQFEYDLKIQEIQEEIKAALTVALKDKHIVLHLQDQVLKLIERADEIQNSDKSEAVKEAQIDVLSETITLWRGQLRGLLQGDNRQDEEGGDTKAED